MRKFAIAAIAALIFAATLPAQITVTAARHISFGSSTPATCSPLSGDVFFVTTGTMYICTATNTWTAVGSGSGSVTSVTIAGTANQIDVAGSCTITTTGTCTLSLDSAITLPGTINKYTLTAPATAATLTIANNKTLTVSNSIIFAGTDSTTMTFPATSASIARTDAGQTFTGAQTFSSATFNSTGVSITAGNGTTGTIAVGDSNFSKTAGSGFTFNSAVIPSSDGSLDLGSLTAHWRDFDIARNVRFTGVAFASLGTPSTNGAFTYCQDCDAGLLGGTCTSAGAKTGNFAMYLNSVWRCID